MTDELENDTIELLKSFVLLCIKNSNPDKLTRTGNQKMDSFFYHCAKSEESAYYNVLRRIKELI